MNSKGTLIRWTLSKFSPIWTTFDKRVIYPISMKNIANYPVDIKHGHLVLDPFQNKTHRQTKDTFIINVNSFVFHFTTDVKKIFFISYFDTTKIQPQLLNFF